jgi:hypothetical protein
LLKKKLTLKKVKEPVKEEIEEKSVQADEGDKKDE